MRYHLLAVLACAAQLLGCRTIQTQSDLNLTNSLEDKGGLFKPVFRIGGRAPDETDPGKLAACTATAVSPNTAITAGHCVSTGYAMIEDLRIIEGETELIDLRPKQFNGVLLHPNFTSSDTSVSNDLAVLVFDGAPFRDAFVSLATEPAAVGNRITIIGYGKKDHTIEDSSGGRHYGVNDISSISIDQNTIDFLGHPRYVGQTEDGLPVYVDMNDQANHTAAGKKVGASHGDSGGPMLLKGFLVGVASNINQELTSAGMIHAHYEYVLGESAVNFLRGTQSNGAVISGLHNQERRKLLTPQDLEDVVLDHDTIVQSNPNASGSDRRDLIDARCVCTVNATECRLDLVNKSGQTIVDLASDEAEACRTRGCEENFSQYAKVCRQISRKGS